MHADLFSSNGSENADSCPTQALRMVDEAGLSKIKGKLEVLHPEYGTGPRVYYLNVPGRFVAGTVYDVLTKRIVNGANCTLAGESVTLTAQTDGFGDFWFENLKDGLYSLKIEAKNYHTKTIAKISTEKDVNLGDIPL